MMRSLTRRLNAVVTSPAFQVEEGCDTCRQYPGIVIVDDDGHLSRPEQCPDCSRNVPIFQLIHIVGVPMDAL